VNVQRRLATVTLLEHQGKGQGREERAIAVGAIVMLPREE